MMVDRPYIKSDMRGGKKSQIAPLKNNNSFDNFEVTKVTKWQKKTGRVDL